MHKELALFACLLWHNNSMADVKQDPRTRSTVVRQLLLLAGDVERNPGPQLVVGTQNVTSCNSQIAAIQGILEATGTHVMGITETRVLRAGRAFVENAMAESGMRVLWAEAADVGPNLYSCSSRGVALLLPREALAWTVTPNDEDTLLYVNEGRLGHYEVACGEGGNTVHILLVYAYQQREASRREALLRTVFRYAAGLGQVPVVVMGDMNADGERSKALHAAVIGGWTDASLECAEREGRAPPVTYRRSEESQDGTRIDMILLNQVAATGLRSSSTVETSFPQHCTVTAELGTEAFSQACLAYRLPKAIDVDSWPTWSNEEEDELAEECARGCEAPSPGVAGEWANVTAAMEEYLLRRDSEVTHTRGHRGRGALREPIVSKVAVETRCKGSGEATLRQVHVMKALNKTGAVLRMMRTAETTGIALAALREPRKRGK